MSSNSKPVFLFLSVYQHLAHNFSVHHEQLSSPEASVGSPSTWGLTNPLLLWYSNWRQFAVLFLTWEPK